VVDDELVGENERLRRENAELRERVDVLESALEVFGTMAAEGRKAGVFGATKRGPLGRLADRVRRRSRRTSSPDHAVG
jgi:hypothetical protein